MKARIKRALVCSLAVVLVCCHTSAIFAQVDETVLPYTAMQKPQPPMENVFFNVLWGSLTGGMLMMGWSSLDDSKPEEERYGVSNLSVQFLTGATYGGLLGLITGVYLSMKGISFDENRTKIAFLQYPQEEILSLSQQDWEKKEFKKPSLGLVNFQLKF